MIQLKTVPNYNLGQPNFSDEIFHIVDVDSIVTNPKNTVAPIQMFGGLVYKNELTVIGGTDNTGKSLFAMDILIAGATLHHFWGNMKVEEKMKGLLIDTELNNIQFARRYCNLRTDGQILRAGFWPAIYGRKTADEILCHLEAIFNREDCPRLVVIDNLSTIAKVSSGNQMQHFLSELKRLKEIYGITMVIITHLNKTSQKKPVSKDDFRGSKQLTNMADTVIGIGNTCLGANVKYISLLKTRNSEKPETVSVVSISSDPYLHFQYEDEELVENVLPSSRPRGPEPIISDILGQQIVEMKEAGLSSRCIGNTLGIGKSTICRFLNTIE